MRRGVTILILLFIIGLLQVQAAEMDNLSELEAFFDGVVAIQQKLKQVPAVSVAVVKDGELLFSKGYGFSDIENSIKMDPSVILHRQASISKVLTWTAVMQLVEKGDLDLYTDINTYLDFSIPTTLADGTVVPPITLHHLLTHTAGFEDVVVDVVVLEEESYKPFDEHIQERLPARVFPPGRVLAYSNYGADLAGYIVQCVSRQPFEKYVEENIFKPLNMTSSTFAQPLPPELASWLSGGYHYKDGRYQKGPFFYNLMVPAGNLICPPEDLANLIIAHLQLGAFQDQRILQEETARLMQSTHFRGHPEIPGMAYGFIEMEYNGYRVLSHGGNIFLFHSGLFFLPEEQVGLYVSYNSSSSANAWESFFEAFMNRFFSEPEGHMKRPGPVQKGTESKYTGVFHDARNSFTQPESVMGLLRSLYVDIDKDGYLLLRSGGQSIALGEIKPGVFQELDGRMTLGLAFEDGKVSKIHLPGPSTWLRTPWYHTPKFILGLMAVFVLVMLSIVLGWFKQLFAPRNRKRSFAVPKIVGLLFIVAFLTTAAFFIVALSDVHPMFQVPMIALGSAGRFEIGSKLATSLFVLYLLVFLTCVYTWFRRRGSLWQRGYYTLFTISGGSVVWVFWQFNFF